MGNDPFATGGLWLYTGTGLRLMLLLCPERLGVVEELVTGLTGMEDVGPKRGDIVECSEVLFAGDIGDAPPTTDERWTALFDGISESYKCGMYS
jgi:hypothetical protein